MKAFGNWITVLSILFSLCFIQSCSNGEDNSRNQRTSETVNRDLQDIQEEGVLRAVTLYSSTNYFLYRGQPMGYEYELLTRLCDYLNLKLELIVVNNVEELKNSLLRGKADVIAAGLTATNDRRKVLAFTEYLYLTKQVLIQRKPENWRKLMRHQVDHQLVKDPIELIGDTVHVRKNTSYYQRLKNLQDEIGGNIHIVLVGKDVPTEKLIEQVVSGEIKYTVADNNVAEVNASYYPILDVNTAISFSQRIAWAVRKESPALLDTVNYWIKKMKKYNAYYTTYDKYFRSSRSFKKRVDSDFYSGKTGKISPYDEIIKKNTEDIGWDWVLVSSLIYQESRFNPEAEAWTSANGLMQLMPSTAMELGVSDMRDPHQNIRAGVRYLKSLWDQWESIPDSIQRLKFTFASYNCGLQHVADAQRLAEKFGQDPLVWDNQVEQQVLNLTYPKYYRDKVVKFGYVRGREPVNYVREIFERYKLYRQFVSG